MGAVVPWPQDGEVNAAPVSGGLGKGVTGVSGIFPASTLYLGPQLTSTLLTSQPQLIVYPYSPFNFLPYQLSNFPNLQPFFFSPSLQVKHVLAGSEYSGSAAAQRDERALVFGDDVPADKFRSCKKTRQ